LELRVESINVSSRNEPERRKIISASSPHSLSSIGDGGEGVIVFKHIDNFFGFIRLY